MKALTDKITLSPDGLVFEPRDLTHINFAQESIVCKKLIDTYKDSEQAAFRNFERRIFVVRDPRDNLISRALYKVYRQAAFNDDASPCDQRWASTLRRFAVRAIMRACRDEANRLIITVKCPATPFAERRITAAYNIRALSSDNCASSCAVYLWRQLCYRFAGDFPRHECLQARLYLHRDFVCSFDRLLFRRL